MLVATAIEELRARLGELAEDFWTDAQVYRILSEAQNRFCAEESWQFMLTTLSTSLAAGDTAIDLPDNVGTEDLQACLMTLDGQTVPFEPRMVLPIEGFKLRRMFSSPAQQQYPISYYVSDTTQANANEVQTLVNAGSTSGTFTLTFDGQTTAVIARGASAQTVEDALKALSNVGPGDVVVTGGPLGTDTIRVEFVGALGHTNVPAMTLGGTTTALTLTTVISGAGGSGTFISTVTFVPALTVDANLEFLYVRQPVPVVESNPTGSLDIPEKYAMGVVAWACGTLWLKELQDSTKATEQYQLYQQVVQSARKKQAKAAPVEKLAWGKNDPEMGGFTQDDWVRMHIPSVLG